MWSVQINRQRCTPYSHFKVSSKVIISPSVVLTQHSRYQTEDHSENDEGPVPGVRTGHRGNAQEDEDERLAHTAPHLQEIFHGGVWLVGDVGLHVGPHHHATCYQSVRDRKKKRRSERFAMTKLFFPLGFRDLSNTITSAPKWCKDHRLVLHFRKLSLMTDEKTDTTSLA